jgi:hypothetical protein
VVCWRQAYQRGIGDAAVVRLGYGKRGGLTFGG